jgi:hypothetical protein
MLLTRTVTKKILEAIVHETFTQFGNLSSSSLLDSLKLLGFYYATTAGISINIEDLKTPDSKKEFLDNANKEIDFVSNQWQQGLISDTERFQTIIDTWNLATEGLKNRIIDYYQNFDPANNLYIMAFSGARGNMSQVRQLVGMRGLMSDQEGKIIDLPIQTNFREGLSSIDYIISSYGARKGIVDTALKTADSGYLTRRLIYVAQDLVIREINCSTKEGIIFLLNSNSNTKNLIGRTLLSIKSFLPIRSQNQTKLWFSKKKKKQEFFQTKILPKILDQTLSEELLQELIPFAPLTLNVRSSLTCKSNGSICQKCYGWDLAQGKKISLGEAVGIIAAQSIGEPGTQLTMRTFHTGGIFTGETNKQIFAPFSGKFLIPKTLKAFSYRTNHGVLVLKLQQETKFTILNWKGEKKEIFLNVGSYLYIATTSFVKKGQLIGEYSLQSFSQGIRRLKPIYTTIAGEVKFENLVVRKILREKKEEFLNEFISEDEGWGIEERIIKVNQDDGVLWIASGKIFSLPNEVKMLSLKNLFNQKALAKLKIISPLKGFIKIKKNSFVIFGEQKEVNFEFTSLIKSIKNCFIKFSFLVRNHQYIDEHTVIGSIEIFSCYEGLVYSIRYKDSKYMRTFFFITESDIFKINSDQVNDYSLFQNKKTIIRSGNFLNETSIFSRSGFFLKKDGFQIIYQHAIPIFLTRGTILNYNQGDFVLENKMFATLINYTQQTEDIVQGLPKIEELIEARKPKEKAFLAIKPGIFIKKCMGNEKRVANSRTIFNGIIKCTLQEFFPDLNSKTKKQQEKENEKQIIYLGQSLSFKEEIIVFQEKIYKVIPIPSPFILASDLTEIGEIYFFTLKKKGKKEKEMQKLIFYKKEKFSFWQPFEICLKTKKKDKFQTSFQNQLFQYKYGKLFPWGNGKKIFIYENKKKEKEDLILQYNTTDFYFLEYLNPLKEYKFPLTSSLLFEIGKFIDLGEPITEGIIDAHELLDLLFQYHSTFDGILRGTHRSLLKFQLIFVNSIQSIYQSQGVNISSKHIEIVVRQMTSKVKIKEPGDTPFLPGELIRLSLLNEICYIFKSTKFKKKIPKYEPVLVSTTTSSLSKDGFLSAAGFQETKRVLTKAALEGSCDWLRGLKECIILGRLIPAGSAFLNYKNYLDSVYSFKD